MVGTGVCIANLLYGVQSAELCEGPVLMTVGPWKPVGLHIYQSRITDLDIRPKVSESLDISLTADFTYSKAPGFASFVLKNANGTVEASSDKLSTESGHSTVSFEFPSGKLQLWYPVGYGQQPLYTVEVEISDAVSKHKRSAPEMILR